MAGPRRTRRGSSGWLVANGEIFAKAAGVDEIILDEAMLEKVGFDVAD